MKKTETTKTVTTPETKKAPAKKAPAKKTPAKAPEEKAKKVTFSERRDSLKSEIITSKSIQFETETTAVNKIDSAMILHDNAIMLTLVSEETQKASRVLEIWIHAKRNDVCISKRLFDSITETNKDLANYRQYIDEKAKSSKYVLKLADDAITKEFTNLLIKSL
jgi:hypothetical protein